MSSVPTAAECRAYWDEVRAPSILRRHLEAVATTSMLIVWKAQARGVTVDASLVEAAALLHDIGRVKDQGAEHGAVGAEMVLAKGWDRRVARAVACHVGGGLDAKDVKIIGLPRPPEGDYMPRSLEEKIVCFGDKLIGLDERQPLEEEYRKLRLRKLDRAVERIEALRADLRVLIGSDPAQV